MGAAVHCLSSDHFIGCTNLRLVSRQTRLSDVKKMIEQPLGIFFVVVEWLRDRGNCQFVQAGLVDSSQNRPVLQCVDPAL